MHQIKFKLSIRKTFLIKKLVRHWNRLPRAVAESPFLEEFKNVDVA